jgi:hypothetical protein
MSPNDIRTVEAEFARRFSDRKAVRAPRIPGRNIVTPTVLGFVVAASSDPCEVSTGTSWLDTGSRIFGVTFARTEAGLPDDRDRMFHSLAEVDAYLAGEA